MTKVRRKIIRRKMWHQVQLRLLVVIGVYKGLKIWGRRRLHD